ncbi:pentatricopeptide repeat-containing protein At1g77360, mitochondrial-like [Olea europaea var. sylvestris]|uniref:pentatricopeptide repeat-containing protein At1g77360, mitochondrial-like n=1 Tax=Olea europaea var. sylvestris TaxID=158386 RepID=UPI000C1D29AC|nr:pentatricopeptide repeat-containing protein At1g77360, mitochondrial-like [Olea europaea var. sylvestris]
MGRKRPQDEDYPSSSKFDPNDKHYRRHSNYSPSSARNNFASQPHYDYHQQIMGKRSKFISYLEVPSLTPKVKILCEIIANTPSASVEKLLEDTGVRVSQEDVEEVLKLSYGFPGPAVKFFRWSGFLLNDKHSLYAWNLVVDLLGKNGLFDAMWDAIKSMRKEGLLSLATFASIFSSYVAGNRVQEAIMTFEVIDQYGVPRDVVALNSLLSAICREGKTPEAKDYLVIAKNTNRVDADSYAILLEGLENEGDVVRARQTFMEMVADIGWDPRNAPAYESFLSTLLKGPEGIHEALKYLNTMIDRRCYPGMKFFKFAIDECVRKSDAKGAKVLWEVMVGKNVCKPDREMYNSLISLYCNLKDFDFAKSLLDEMVYNGAFPDSETYNILFHFLIRCKRLREAIPIFNEMLKNECVPIQADSSAAIKAYIDAGDPHMAIRIWRCMVENYRSDLEETSNLLVLQLRDINWIPEAVKFAEDVIERGIKLSSATLSKLKQSLIKVGKTFVYDELLQKWKTH